MACRLSAAPYSTTLLARASSVCGTTSVGELAQERKHALERPAVRRIEQSRRGEPRLGEHRLAMREREERSLAVIAADAGAADAAEVQVLVREVPERVV